MGLGIVDALGNLLAVAAVGGWLLLSTVAFEKAAVWTVVQPGAGKHFGVKWAAARKLIVVCMENTSVEIPSSNPSEARNGLLALETDYKMLEILVSEDLMEEDSVMPTRFAA